MSPGQEANGGNLGMSFRSSIIMVCCVHSLDRLALIKPF